jgi:hypothetical protein
VTIARAAKIGSFIGPLLPGALELDIAVGGNSRAGMNGPATSGLVASSPLRFAADHFYASIVASVGLTIC